MTLQHLTAGATGVLLSSVALGAPQGFDSMIDGSDGYRTKVLWTVGETLGGYTPPGILDGLGAFELNATTIRVLANHELLNFRGYPYDVEDGQGGTFSLQGARVSYFDIDKASMSVVATGLAYSRIFDSTGTQATDAGFLPEPQAPFFGSTPSPHLGYSRFCSSSLFEAEEFGDGRGLADRIYFTGEEDGSGFNSVGGLEWALDPANGDMWAIPAVGRGAWENLTVLDTGNSTEVALLLMDDSSPFDADSPFALPVGTGDADSEAAPFYLYVGTKNDAGDFPARNGLRDGNLYVWVADDPAIRTPADFNGSGTQSGQWIQIDNTPDIAQATQDGTLGYDEYGYPTQRLLWLRAEEVGAFGFSRPEDVATNPFNGSEAVVASTGVDTYVNGADTFGTLYTIDTDFSDLSADLTILYDGDADPARALRSPDNVDWADDGFIYVNEDEAEEDTLTGEPLFGPGAVNPFEASIVKVDPATGVVSRVGEIDRTVVIDPTIADPFAAVDQDAGEAGEWETSGILDVSRLFGRELGTLFLVDVQAHGIEDQETVNPASRINDDDLVEGGQLLFLELSAIGDRYCAAAVNSSGAPASIRAEGSTAVADNDLILAGADLPAGTVSIAVFGTTQDLVPVGSGFLCIGGNVGRIDQITTVDAAGNAEIEVDLTGGGTASTVIPGATVNFQLWFRDNDSGVPTSNFSDGVNILWR